MLTFEHPNLNFLLKKSTWASNNKKVAIFRQQLRKDRSKININKLLMNFNHFTISERLQYFTILRLFKILKFNVGNLKCLFSFSNVHSDKLIIPVHRLKFSEKFYL